MLTSKQNKTLKKKLPKISQIRHSEYYDMQTTFDRLYEDSTKGKNFNSLIELITTPENIMLAYRNIKKNDGSNTPGIDGRTIDDLSKLNEEDYLKLINRKFSNYRPNTVRRVEIPKRDGKKRLLGIPTIIDRIVQQCIKQVIEPIVEAKFYYHSYGFRPDRSAENAIARVMQLMQNSNMHYVVDVDIKGFFDNVWHSKLIKQLWTLGVRDKKLLSIIKAMLKAPVVLENGKVIYPTKGTSQGGILSPLLANVVLNELDKWIESQWESFPMRSPYKPYIRKNGSVDNSAKYSKLKKDSKLKPIFIVRYADDFKIFCKSYNEAIRTFEGTKKWLEERLKLDICKEKSKIVNLRKKYSEFLGYKLKVHLSPKKNKWVVKSYMCDKAKERIIIQIREAIEKIENTQEKEKQYQAISRYNALVMGVHNYYRIATHISVDCRNIEWRTGHMLKNRLTRIGLSKEPKGNMKDSGIYKSSVLKWYGKSRRLRYLRNHYILPIGFVSNKIPMSRTRKINRYTKEGRALKHQNLKFDTGVLRWLMRNPVKGQSIEYADNRISLYAAQYGKCAVTNELLEAHDIHCHHKVPKQYGGSDNYSNLLIVSETVHKLIHATKKETLNKYLKILGLNEKQLRKLNKLRLIAKVESIVEEI